jgi:hypothetical protein
MFAMFFYVAWQPWQVYTSYALLLLSVGGYAVVYVLGQSIQGDLSFITETVLYCVIGTIMLQLATVLALSSYIYEARKELHRMNKSG